MYRIFLVVLDLNWILIVFIWHTTYFLKPCNMARSLLIVPVLLLKLVFFSTHSKLEIWSRPRNSIKRVSFNCTWSVRAVKARVWGCKMNNKKTTINGKTINEILVFWLKIRSSLIHVKCSNCWKQQVSQFSTPSKL